VRLAQIIRAHIAIIAVNILGASIKLTDLRLTSTHQIVHDTRNTISHRLDRASIHAIIGVEVAHRDQTGIVGLTISIFVALRLTNTILATKAASQRLIGTNTIHALASIIEEVTIESTLIDQGMALIVCHAIHTPVILMNVLARVIDASVDRAGVSVIATEVGQTTALDLGVARVGLRIALIDRTRIAIVGTHDLVTTDARATQALIVHCAQVVVIALRAIWQQLGHAPMQMTITVLTGALIEILTLTIKVALIVGLIFFPDIRLRPVHVMILGHVDIFTLKLVRNVRDIHSFVDIVGITRENETQHHEHDHELFHWTLQEMRL
jgi:hypothetical protein